MIQKHFSLTLSLLCALSLFHSGCASNPTTPSIEKNIPVVGEFAAQRFTFPNGLKLIVIENHSSPTFAYQTWYNVGSRHEVKGKTGIAHLFEHMMFKQTKNLKEGEFDKILERAGVVGLNAFTNKDYTAYIQQLPNDKLDLITQLESERMVNLVVDDKAFETETEVVQNERRFRYENNPDGTLYLTLYEVAYKTHPYHWPVIGYQPDLDAMTAVDGRTFYQTYYSPNNATIVVVGDVSPSKVYDLVNKHYGQIPRREIPPSKIKPEPKVKEVRRKTLELNMEVEKLYVAFHIPSITHTDTAAFTVLGSILSGGKSSRLNQALVETGIATDVSSGSMENADPTLFLFSANLQKGKSATEGEAKILKEIEKLAKTPVSAAELEKAKNMLNFSFYENMSSNYLLAQFVGNYETVTGKFENGLKVYTEQIAKITPADIQRVAKEYLNPGSRIVITGVPKK